MWTTNPVGRMKNAKKGTLKIRIVIALNKHRETKGKNFGLLNAYKGYRKYLNRDSESA